MHCSWLVSMIRGESARPMPSTATRRAVAHGCARGCCLHDRVMARFSMKGGLNIAGCKLQMGNASHHTNEPASSSSRHSQLAQHYQRTQAGLRRIDRCLGLPKYGVGGHMSPEKSSDRHPNSIRIPRVHSPCAVHTVRKKSVRK